MSLFVYFGTPESRSFQFFWTAGTRPVFSVAFRLFNASHIFQIPRSRAGEWGDPGSTCPDNGPAAHPGGPRPKNPREFNHGKFGWAAGRQSETEPPPAGLHAS